MPISNHARRTRPGQATPAGPMSRRDQVWPAVIALTAVVVFIVFLVQAGLMMAVVMALATLLAGGILVTLVTGTAWLTRLTPHLRGRH